MISSKENPRSQVEIENPYPEDTYKLASHKWKFVLFDLTASICLKQQRGT